MATLDRTSTGWQVRWRTPEHRSRKKNFTRKPDAKRFKVSIEHSVLAGSYVDPTAGRVSFRSFTEDWRSVQVHRQRTAVQLEGILRLHVYPRLGDRPIGSIRRSEVQALIRALSDELAPGTVGLVFKWVRTIFRAAVSDRVISETPCRDIQLPSTQKPKVHPWEPTRVAALVDAFPDRYRALVLLGAGTGVRISEALALTVDRVDWMRRTVRIDHQLVGVEDDEPVFGPVKDRKNRPRTIPLPDAVLEALVEHCSTFDRRDGLLFVGPNGGPIRPSTWSRVWQSAAAPAGIAKGEGFHQLRHFYASTLIRAGESVKVIQDRLGHSSATMTLDTYGHLWPSDDDRTRAALDAVLGRTVSAVCPRQVHPL